MTKAELSKRISERTGLDREKAMEAIEAFMSEVQYAVGKGQEVSLRGFGTFFTKLRRAKAARKNFQNGPGETIHIPAQYQPKFKPAKTFVKTIAKIYVK